jgi:hypothetical protein
MHNVNKSIKKLVDTEEELTPADLIELKEFLRMQAKMIVEIFESNKIQKEN